MNIQAGRRAGRTGPWSGSDSRAGRNGPEGPGERGKGDQLPRLLQTSRLVYSGHGLCVHHDIQWARVMCPSWYTVGTGYVSIMIYSGHGLCVHHDIQWTRVMCPSWYTVDTGYVSIMIYSGHEWVGGGQWCHTNICRMNYRFCIYGRFSRKLHNWVKQILKKILSDNLNNSVLIQMPNPPSLYQRNILVKCGITHFTKFIPANR